MSDTIGIHNDDIINKMKGLPAFKNFKPKDIETVLRGSRLLEFKAGEMILEEGKFEPWIYFLISGKVKIFKDDKTLLCILQDSGDVFGEMGGIQGKERSASAHAMEDSMCLVISVEDIEKAALENQMDFKYQLYKEFAEVLAGRLRLTTEELVKLSRELAEAKAELARLKAGEG